MADKSRKAKKPKLTVEEPYIPHHTLDIAVKMGLIGGGGGLFVSALQNALAKENVGALSVFTRGRTNIAIGVLGPASYALFSRGSMNLREKDDGLSAALGGVVGGTLIGLYTGRLAWSLGIGAAFGTFQGTFFYLGNRYDSFRREQDEFARKEVLRRTTRRPAKTTVPSQIGESQPDIGAYEKIRRRYVKARYGIEINPVEVTVDGSH